MKRFVLCSVLCVGIGSAGIPASAVLAQSGLAPGQLQETELQTAAGVSPGQLAEAQAFVVEPAITNTQLTARGHQLGPSASSGNLEGNACPAGFKMISGACHPGYTDQVIIINQFPNQPANTWRCGFANVSGSNRTVWIYTLCGQ